MRRAFVWFVGVAGSFWTGSAHAEPGVLPEVGALAGSGVPMNQASGLAILLMVAWVCVCAAVALARAYWDGAE